jgi:hypothetical protein
MTGGWRRGLGQARTRCLPSRRAQLGRRQPSMPSRSSRIRQSTRRVATYGGLAVPPGTSSPTPRPWTQSPGGPQTYRAGSRTSRLGENVAFRCAPSRFHQGRESAKLGHVVSGADEPEEQLRGDLDIGAGLRSRRTHAAAPRPDHRSRVWTSDDRTASAALSADTADDRCQIVRRFTEFAGKYPWNWTAAHVDEWSTALQTAGHPSCGGVVIRPIAARVISRFSAERVW